MSAVLLKDLLPGTVLCAMDQVEETLTADIDGLPAVRPSDKELDPTVYGVFRGWLDEEHVLSTKYLAAVLTSHPRLQDQVVRTEPIHATPWIPVDTVTVRMPFPNHPGAFTEEVQTWGRDKVAPPGMTVVSREPVPDPEPVDERVQVWFRRPVVAVRGVTQVLVIGRCNPGDILTTSGILGTAQVAPMGTDVRFVLGKVVGTKKSDKQGLVRAVLWAG